MIKFVELIESEKRVVHINIDTISYVTPVEDDIENGPSNIILTNGKGIKVRSDYKSVLRKITEVQS